MSCIGFVKMRIFWWNFYVLVILLVKSVVTSGFIRLLHDDGDDKRVHCYACSGYKECMHPTSKPCEGPLTAKEGPEKAMLQELGALPAEGLTHCISIAFWADDKPRMLRGCIPKKLGNEEACAKVEAMAGFENVECDICEGGADEGCNGPRVRRQEGEETTPAPAEVKTTVAEGNETAAPNETMPVTGSNDPGKDDGGGGGGGDGGDGGGEGGGDNDTASFAFSVSRQGLSVFFWIIPMLVLLCIFG